MVKQIQYTDYYIDGKRKGNVGFFREYSGNVELVLRNVPIQGKAERVIYCVDELEEEKKQIGNIFFQDGMGQAQLKLGKGIKELKLFIPIFENSYVACEAYNEVKNVEGAKVIEESKQSIETSGSMENDRRIEPIVESDKWKQIYKSYPNVHIFPQTQGVLLKPKDLIMLRKDYHVLATNSFLLHSYYNYRQLLFFYSNADEKYYLGVPGVFCDREYRLACMFGFSEFESGESRMENGKRGEIYAGCFGYYKKQVEI